MNTSRGIRNNNPLNIRRSATRWLGQAEEQADKDFVQFKSMAYGYRAAWRILQSYYKRFCTQGRPFNVPAIISRWAPPSENDTEGYIRSVLSLSGLGGHENLLPPSNAEGYGRTGRLLAAMTCIECGIPAARVDTAAIAQGFRLAFPRNAARLDEWLEGEDEYREW